MNNDYIILSIINCNIIEYLFLMTSIFCMNFVFNWDFEKKFHCYTINYMGKQPNMLIKTRLNTFRLLNWKLMHKSSKYPISIIVQNWGVLGVGKVAPYKSPLLIKLFETSKLHFFKIHATFPPLLSCFSIANIIMITIDAESIITTD